MSQSLNCRLPSAQIHTYFLSVWVPVPNLDYWPPFLLGGGDTSTTSGDGGGTSTTSGDELTDITSSSLQQTNKEIN